MGGWGGQTTSCLTRYLHFNDVVTVANLLAVELDKGKLSLLRSQLHLVVDILHKNLQVKKNTLLTSKTDMYSKQVKTDMYTVQVKNRHVHCTGQNRQVHCTGQNRYLHLKNKTFAGQKQKLSQKILAVLRIHSILMRIRILDPH